MYRNHNGEIVNGAEGADHDALLTKLGEARDELFDYERMFETLMINGPEYVVDEMVSEIKRLRSALKFYADEESYHVFTDDHCPVLFDDGELAREALK